MIDDFPITIDELPHDDANVALELIHLGGATPTSIEQRIGRGHARRCWNGFLAEHPGQRFDGQLGVRPCQRPQIGWNFLSRQLFTGWVAPSC